MKEIWKDIPGYEGRYQASTLGRIRNSKKILSQWSECVRGNKYYLKCALNSSPKLVHRMIALTFIPNPDNKPAVDHVDFDEQNNKVGNLRWVTPKENSLHSKERLYIHKGMKGEKHPRAKFTDKQVEYMRELRAQGVKYRVIAEIMNANENTISCILLRGYYDKNHIGT